MDNIITFKEKTPNIEYNTYINPFAVIIGDVTVHSGASLWPGVIVHAEEEHIEIGKNSVLLDRVLIESPLGYPVNIGKNVLVSHNVKLHGCIVKDDVLIGIGTNILDGAVIGEGSVIGANTLVPADMEIPPRSKVSGAPCKIIGKVTDLELQEIRKKHNKILDKAKEYGEWFVMGKI